MAETHEDEKAGFTISSSTCKRYFGYLSQREKGAAMPDECLTCDRMIDCMFSKPDAPTVTMEKKTESAVPETADEEPVAEETFEESAIVSEPEIIQAEIEVENEEEATFKLDDIEPVEPEKPTAKPAAKRPNDEFIVETPGHVYNQWSGTVLVNKETLEGLGKKVKEVYLQNNRGIRVKCRVYAIPDMESWVIQIPDKVKADLEVGNGDRVKVTPK
jgi:hypothetical protein